MNVPGMKKFVLYTIAVLLCWVFLAQYVLFQNRVSDNKAYRIFKEKNIPLTIHDTLLNNRHLHYAVSGEANLPTLVFIHGSPGSWMNYMSFMWDTTLRKKFRIVSIDRPGFGQSDYGNALPLKEQCNLILPVLQNLKGSQPLYVCGHSMGGPVVVQLAAMDPHLFHTIVIVGGALDVALEEKETWRRIMNLKPLNFALPGAFGPSNRELLYLKKDLRPLQQEFQKLTCGVRFIHGDQDKMVSIKNVGYGKKMMINARSIATDTIRNAGHYIPWKNKKAFTRILLELY